MTKMFRELLLIILSTNSFLLISSQNEEEEEVITTPTPPSFSKDPITSIEYVGPDYEPTSSPSPRYYLPMFGINMGYGQSPYGNNMGYGQSPYGNNMGYGQSPYGYGQSTYGNNWGQQNPYYPNNPNYYQMTTPRTTTTTTPRPLVGPVKCGRRISASRWRRNPLDDGISDDQEADDLEPRGEEDLPLASYNDDDNAVVITEDNADENHESDVDATEDADDPERRVVGGKMTTIDQWPWQVSLKSSGVHICGGSLISDRDPSYFKAYLGKSNKFVKDREPGEVELDIVSINLHARYNRPRAYDNDIALLRLAKPVRFSRNILPVCLPRKGEQLPIATSKNSCFVTGFGDTRGTGGDSSLKMAKMPIIPPNKCKAIDSKYRRILTENMFCAGYLAGGTDSCKGDSGGPLVCQSQAGTFTLHGAVSFGWDCAKPKNPGIYTKVSNYLPWIKSKMGRTAN